MKKPLTLKEYIKGFKDQNIMVLSKAISLVESSRVEDRELASELLEKLKPEKFAKVIGVSGTPGVGKSSFIETFGNILVDKGQKLAVLAIDPSSVRTGGSILGDKTRMETLATRAFIRPSASGTTLGGVAAKTKESIMLCEAFGFDVILIETVGVGQSEVTVSQMVDFFLLLMQPGSGDNLQGIKRGILEVCHMVAVNKADGDLINEANIAKSEYEMALRILRSTDVYKPTVKTCSALKNIGLEDIWTEIKVYFENAKISEIRNKQNSIWFDQQINDEIQHRIKSSTKFQIEKSQLVKKKVFHIRDAQKLVDELFAGKFKND